MNTEPNPIQLNRRGFLYGMGASLGTVAFNAMLARGTVAGPLSPKPGHFKAKANRCIFLFMEGGPSHIDTFDPKPKLDEMHGKTFKAKGELLSMMASGQRMYVRSPWEFKRYGQSGIPMSEPWRHLTTVADELCLYRGMQAESINHPTACLHMNTGNRFGGDPAIGAWTTYGLGSLNENVPSYVVLGNAPQGGPANWSNGFLPAHYQGTPFREGAAPILDLKPPSHVTPEAQRRSFDLLGRLERDYRAANPQNRDLQARMDAYELAFRMQADVPDLIDLNREDQATKELYGMDDGKTAAFGRRCLMARRLVEEGVRFVQVIDTGWDAHSNIQKSHGESIAKVDKPITGLIKDLKRRGLLDSTLIVWCGEFGRTPDNGRGNAPGRDHNSKGMSVFLAGGGCRAGHVIGATDELGREAVEVVHPIKDFHVTLLRLLGLDDNKLTYYHGGRFKQLSQTGGQVNNEIRA
jgi:hypothetical protein